MSYCRFSSDNFKSDVYAYEHIDDGYYIHVAAMRLENPPPLDPDIPNNAQLRSNYIRKLERAKRVKIELPHAGETLACATLEELRKTLLELRGIGYHVPDSAISLIDSEILDEALERDTRGLLHYARRTH